MPELYDTIGTNYARYRRPDPSIFSAILTALSDARSVVNIGAGTGSYEPKDRYVVAVEPSETMIRQRTAKSAPLVRASAMNLPFRDDAFDAALAILTVHHWPDQKRGLKEMTRVAKRSIILTWDQEVALGMWLTRDYFPEIAELGKTVCPPPDSYRSAFDRVKFVTVPVPCDCTDGFLQAYWRRPEVYFSDEARGAISAFALIDVGPGLSRLRRDLDDGSWARRNADILDETKLDLGYRLIIGDRP
jgi:SAM-dependent methyltransferase